ncbi:hypothetical protein EVAR_71811_1 [Eumeta japonica]|uniref:Uncharacterized protein n=1 Tax=Eumeta variegata TaxID=151549 RepID=A0A4C1T5J4_EUMVA|nr:hypothetical protein EVAR_71811_1 [Eumeta japonica]
MITSLLNSKYFTTYVILPQLGTPLTHVISGTSQSSWASSEALRFVVAFTISKILSSSATLVHRAVTTIGSYEGVMNFGLSVRSVCSLYRPPNHLSYHQMYHFSSQDCLRVVVIYGGLHALKRSRQLCLRFISVQPNIPSHVALWIFSVAEVKAMNSLKKRVYVVVS